jgi:hypothetical protein
MKPTAEYLGSTFHSCCARSRLPSARRPVLKPPRMVATKGSLRETCRSSDQTSCRPKQEVQHGLLLSASLVATTQAANSFRAGSPNVGMTSRFSGSSSGDPKPTNSQRHSLKTLHRQHSTDNTWKIPNREKFLPKNKVRLALGASTARFSVIKATSSSTERQARSHTVYDDNPMSPIAIGIGAGGRVTRPALLGTSGLVTPTPQASTPRHKELPVLRWFTIPAMAVSLMSCSAGEEKARRAPTRAPKIFSRRMIPRSSISASRSA